MPAADREGGASPAAASVIVARSDPELDGLRAAWLDVVGGLVTTDPDWVAGLTKLLPGAARPHVIAVRRDGSAATLAVGNLRRREIACKVGRKPVYSPTATALTVVEDGLLGPLDDEATRQLARELMAMLDRGEADVCLLQHVPVSSPIRPALRSILARRLREAEAQKRWARDLPDTYDAFLESLSKGMRKGLRQNRRRIEHDFGSSLEVRSFRGPEDAEELLLHAESVTRRTYQRRLGVGFRDTEVRRWSVAEGARRGFLRGWVVFVDGTSIAVDWGLAYNGTFRWVDGAFDPAYARHAPGIYLTGTVIEQLCADPAVRRLDFGLGDSDYKRRLGCESELEGDVLVAASRVRPRWIATAYGGAVAATRIYRAVR